MHDGSDADWEDEENVRRRATTILEFEQLSPPLTPLAPPCEQSLSELATALKLFGAGLGAYAGRLARCGFETADDLIRYARFEDLVACGLPRGHARRIDDQLYGEPARALLPVRWHAALTARQEWQAPRKSESATHGSWFKKSTKILSADHSHGGTSPKMMPCTPVSGPSLPPAAVVCFSYQSQQSMFLCQLRTALNKRGITTIDGMQVPAGADWRRFFFPALKAAAVMMPILSRSFLFSNACEDELTYAVDKKKPLVPVLFDLDDGFSEVLANPDAFQQEDEDIHMRVPKLESFLNRANRVPSNGRFEDDWEGNVNVLCKRVHEILEAQDKQEPDSGASSKGGTALQRTTSAATVYLDIVDDSARCIQALCDQAQPVLRVRAARSLQMSILETSSPIDMLSLQSSLLSDGIVPGILSALAQTSPMDVRIAGAKLIRALCSPLHCKTESQQRKRNRHVAGLVESHVELCGLITLLLGGEESNGEGLPRERIHYAGSAIKYLSFQNSKIKQQFGDEGAIAALLSVYKEAEQNSVERTNALWTLKCLCDAGEGSRNKRYMVESGALEIIQDVLGCAMEHPSAVPAEAIECAGMVWHLASKTGNGAREAVDGLLALQADEMLDKIVHTTEDEDLAKEASGARNMLAMWDARPRSTAQRSTESSLAETIPMMLQAKHRTESFGPSVTRARADSDNCRLSRDSSDGGLCRASGSTTRDSSESVQSFEERTESRRWTVPEHELPMPAVSPEIGELAEARRHNVQLPGPREPVSRKERREPVARKESGEDAAGEDPDDYLGTVLSGAEGWGQDGLSPSALENHVIEVGTKLHEGHSFEGPWQHVGLEILHGAVPSLRRVLGEQSSNALDVGLKLVADLQAVFSNDVLHKCCKLRQKPSWDGIAAEFGVDGSLVGEQAAQALFLYMHQPCPEAAQAASPSWDQLWDLHQPSAWTQLLGTAALSWRNVVFPRFLTRVSFERFVHDLALFAASLDLPDPSHQLLPLIQHGTDNSANQHRILIPTLEILAHCMHNQLLHNAVFQQFVCETVRTGVRTQQQCEQPAAAEYLVISNKLTSPKSTRSSAESIEPTEHRPSSCELEQKRCSESELEAKPDM